MSGINPYESPRPDSPTEQSLPRWSVQSALRLPFNGIMASVVFGWLSFLWSLYRLFMDLSRMYGGPLALLVIAVALTGYCAVTYLIVRGYVAVQRMQDPRAALWAAWCAALPCTCGCFLGLPFALWADWVLRKPRVWSAFRQERLPLWPWRK